MRDVLVIIPAYNAAKTVEAAIDSVLKQDYEDFYLLVTDDGSTDGTWPKLTSYYGEDKMGICQRQHRGVQETVNWTAKQMSSKAILRLDADDTLHPDYLKTVVPGLNNVKVGVVSTDMQYFGDSNAVCMTGGCWPTNCVPATSLIRRAAWEQVGGLDPEMVYEDWDLWLRIKKAGWEFDVIHKPLVNYRLGINARSKWQDLRKPQWEEQIRRRHG